MKKRTVAAMCFALIALVFMFTVASSLIGKNTYVNGETPYEDVNKFPADYRDAIARLKAAHPSWTFVPEYTNVEWSTIYGIECGKSGDSYYSLIPSSIVANDSSMAIAGTRRDDGWWAASPKAVQYYLDPRNWLTENYIFMFADLSYSSKLDTQATIQKVLDGTFMSGKIEDETDPSLTYALAFWQFADAYGVSGVHLAVRVRQEQGVAGTNPLISGTVSGYEGYYNYFNIGASGADRQSTLIAGLNEAKAGGWNKRYVALREGAKLVAQRVNERHQSSIYYQKFDVAYFMGKRTDFPRQYMQNVVAPVSEGNTMYLAYKNAGVLDEAITFTIPIYKNMPTNTAAMDPTTTAAPTEAPTAEPILTGENKLGDLIVFVKGKEPAGVTLDITDEQITASKTVFEKFRDYLNMVSTTKAEPGLVYIQNDSSEKIEEFILPKEISKYETDAELVGDVLALLSSKYNFELTGAGLDHIKKGVIDHLTIVLEGEAATVNYAHQGNLNEEASISAYKIDNYTIIPLSTLLSTGLDLTDDEKVNAGATVLARNFLKGLGFANLAVSLSETVTSQPAGGYDIMSSTDNTLKYPLGYFTAQAGWTKASPVTAAEASINAKSPYEAFISSSVCYEVVSPNNDFDTIVFEYRDASSEAMTTKKLDSIDESRLLVYRVNQAAASKNNSEITDGNYYVQLIGAYVPADVTAASGNLELTYKIGDETYDTGVAITALSFSAEHHANVSLKIDYASAGIKGAVIDVNTPDFVPQLYVNDKAEGANAITSYLSEDKVLHIFDYSRMGGDAWYDNFAGSLGSFTNVESYTIANMINSSSGRQFPAVAYTTKNSEGQLEVKFKYFKKSDLSWAELNIDSGAIASEDICLVEDEADIFVSYITETSDGQKLVIKNARNKAVAGTFSVSGKFTSYEVVRTGGFFYVAYSYVNKSNQPMCTIVAKGNDSSWTKIKYFDDYGLENYIKEDSGRIFTLLKSKDKSIMSVFDGAEWIDNVVPGTDIKDVSYATFDGNAYVAVLTSTNVNIYRYTLDGLVLDTTIDNVDAESVLMELQSKTDSDDSIIPDKLLANVLIKSNEGNVFKTVVKEVNKVNYSLKLEVSTVKDASSQYTVADFSKNEYYTDGEGKEQVNYDTGKYYVYLDGREYEASIVYDSDQKKITFNVNNIPYGIARSAVVYRYESGKFTARGMYCFTLSLDESNKKYVATYHPDLKDLLSYKSVSMRLEGNPGIRYLSHIKKTTIDALLGAGITSSGGDHLYKLTELGTMVRADLPADMEFPYMLLGKRTKSGRSVWVSTSVKNYPYSENDGNGNVQYANVLANITQYNVSYSGNIYAVISIDNVKYVFCGPGNTKSMYWIADYFVKNNSYAAGTPQREYIDSIISAVNGH